MESHALTKSAMHAVPNGAATCPQCAADTVTTFRHHDTFRYGSGKSAVDLSVNLPLRRCGSCEFEFLDDEAERLKHDAICEHLGVLSPGVIRQIRKSYGMTRAAFAEITGLGEATLNRWENSITVQTLANDRYMRLLARPEIMNRLRSWGSVAQTSSAASSVGTSQFRILKVSEDVLLEQEHFQLQMAS